MFYRDENGRLIFKQLDFELFITDIIETVEPKTMKNLEWMTKVMIESIQTCAWEYADESDDIEEEWEDVYYPNY